MCGIVGYLGNENASTILLNGLKKLEYRGYDSSGIATLDNGNISFSKEVGKIANLEKCLSKTSLNGNIGIGHTRWATHGKATKDNAHPHFNNNKDIFVVHNGIIENHDELRNMLKENGYTFYSQTDTEVIPNLIDFEFKKLSSNSSEFIKAISNAINQLKGSFAICIISKYLGNQTVVLKKDSPLVIGVDKENNKYIASDIYAVSQTSSFYILEDNEMAVISENDIIFYDFSLSEISKVLSEFKDLTKDNTKGDFDTFMLKEIHEQSQAIEKLIQAHVKNNEIIFDLKSLKSQIKNINKIYLVACGTAMHAGLASKNTFEKYLKIPTTVCIASEFRYSDILIDENTLSIFISQSGETADTIAALKKAKSMASKTIAISNVKESSITRVSDISLYTLAGQEVAVASTKAYTSQITLLTLLALYLSDDNVKDVISALNEIPNKINEILNNNEEMDKIKKLAKKLSKSNDAYFLGRLNDYYSALEASLKLKEISYIHSEAEPAGELKHGPIALIEKDIPVISIISNPKIADKTLSNIEEVKSRGAYAVCISSKNIEVTNSNLVIEIPETIPELSCILNIIPLQLLAYYTTLEKGLDVDKPRNLAKSVTVE